MTDSPNPGPVGDQPDGSHAPDGDSLDHAPNGPPLSEMDTSHDRVLLTDHAEASDTGASWKRSLLLEVAARVLFPTALVFSVYLLFAGHHDAGGGFSGGLVAGLAFVLRYVAGGRAELRMLVRIPPLVVVGLGLSIALLTALAPLAFGAEVLSSATPEPEFPVLGKVKLASSLLLDAGVYLLIVGVVLDLLRTLGAGIELQAPTDRKGT